MAKEGCGSERRHAGTWEGISSLMCAHAYMWRIHMETGPRRVAEANAGPPLISRRGQKYRDKEPEMLLQFKAVLFNLTSRNRLCDAVTRLARQLNQKCTQMEVQY